MTESVVVCPNVNCAQIMAPQPRQTSPDGTLGVALFVCGCGRKAALLYDAEVGVAVRPEARTWVEEELRTRGFMFPSDWTGGGRFR